VAKLDSHKSTGCYVLRRAISWYARDRWDIGRGLCAPQLAETYASGWGCPWLGLSQVPPSGTALDPRRYISTPLAFSIADAVWWSHVDRVGGRPAT